MAEQKQHSDPLQEQEEPWLSGRRPPNLPEASSTIIPSTERPMSITTQEGAPERRLRFPCAFVYSFLTPAMARRTTLRIPGCCAKIHYLLGLLSRHRDG